MTQSKGVRQPLSQIADQLYAIYLEAGPSGVMPSRKSACAKLGIGESTINRASTYLIEDGRLNRIGHGGALRIEIVGTAYSLRVSTADQHRVGNPYGGEGEKFRPQVQTARWAAHCEALGIKFEDRAVPKAPRMQVKPYVAPRSECGISRIYEVA